MTYCTVRVQKKTLINFIAMVTPQCKEKKIFSTNELG